MVLLFYKHTIKVPSMSKYSRYWRAPCSWLFWTVLCCPCWLLAYCLCRGGRGYCGTRNRSDRRAYPFEEPIPLPDRSHRLSIDTLGAGHGQQTANQQQALFFSRLPKEIRLQIYEYAIGARILHMKQPTEGPSPTTVFTRELQPRRYTCKFGETHWIAQQGWSKCSTRHEYVSPSLLPLLRSCRRVYTEGIDTLYSTNTFDFTDPNTLHSFVYRILPQRLDRIRSVRVFHKFANYHDWWEARQFEAIWGTLLSLSGLRELRLKLMSPSFSHRGDYWTDHEDIWLSSLKQFQNLDVFEVYLPLQRPAQFPEDLNVGSAQLYAVDGNGKPYRDYDVGATEDEWIDPDATAYP